MNLFPVGKSVSFSQRAASFSSSGSCRPVGAGLVGIGGGRASPAGADELGTPAGAGGGGYPSMAGLSSVAASVPGVDRKRIAAMAGSVSSTVSAGVNQAMSKLQ